MKKVTVLFLVLIFAVFGLGFGVVNAPSVSAETAYEQAEDADYSGTTFDGSHSDPKISVSTLDSDE